MPAAVGLVGTIIGGLSAGSVLLNIGASILLNVVSSKLFGPKAPKGAGLSNHQIMVRSGIEHRKIVYGQAMVSGPIVYNNLSGSDGEYLWYVIALAHGECEDLVSIWFDGDEIAKANIAWTVGAAGADGTGTGEVSLAKWTGKDTTRAVNLFYFLGHPDQVATAKLTTPFADWTTSHRLRGITYVAAQLLYNKKTEKVWKQGPPNDIKALLKGRKLYDRRKDALNADPDFKTLERPLKFGGGLKWTDSALTGAALQFADSYSVSAGVLTASDNDDTSNSLVSDMIPVDYAKRYVATVDARQVSGDRKHYLGVAFLDSNGSFITASGDSMTGWDSLGVTAYFHTDAVFAGSTTTYSIDFGAGGTAELPQDTVATHMVLVMLVIRDGAVGTDTTIELSEASIHEYVATRHDFDDDSTWEWSDNPSLCISDYMTQIQGVAYDSLEWPSFISTAQYCDESVAIPTASTETRFTCNGAISLGVSHKENLDSLLSSCAGRLAYTGGVWSLRASQWDEPDYTIDASWLAGPVVVRGSAPDDDRANTIRGFHIDSARKYEAAEFPHVSSAAYVTRDAGRTKPYDLELPMTNTGTMAQRIAYQILEQQNNQQLVTLPLNAKGLKVRVGDTVNMDFPWLGWTAGGNGLPYSEDFSQADWNKVNTTITADAATGPFGRANASLLANDGTAGASYLFDNVTIASGDTVSGTWYAKKKDFDWAFVSLSNGASYGRCYFDLDNGQVGTIEENTFSVLSADIQSVGNGWFRCSILVKTSGVTAVAAQLRIAEDDLDSTLPSSSGQGIYISSAQAITSTEQFPFYQRTTGTPVTSTVKTGRIFEWGREDDGNYMVSIREDDESDYADPIEAEYGSNAGGSVTVPTVAVPAPDNLTATAIRNGVELEWDDVPSRLYDHVEIWASIENVRGSAELIATVPKSPFIDNVADKLNIRYYWIRAVLDEDDVSEYEPSTTTTTASSAPLPPASNLLLDPDFDLSTDLDGDQFWDGSASESGTPGSIATDISFSLTGGANNGPYVTMTVGDPTGLGASVDIDLVSNARFRQNSQTFVARIRYRRDDSGSYDDSFICTANGYSAETGGSIITTATEGVVLADTSDVWTDLTVTFAVVGSATAQFWEFRFDYLKAGPLTGGFSVDIDSIFVYSAPDAFSGEGTLGLVPDPGTETGKFLKDDGTWATP